MSSRAADKGVVRLLRDSTSADAVAVAVVPTIVDNGVLLYTGMQRAHSTSLYRSFPLDDGVASAGHVAKSYECLLSDFSI